MRRVNRKEYPVKAYLVLGNDTHAFWCRVNKKRTIDTGIGVQMESTSKTLYTISPLEFKEHQKIRFARDASTSLAIDSVDSVVVNKNNSARRGNPIYETRIDAS